MNTFQRRALAAYNDGEFAHLAEHADDAFCQALEVCGDGLLKFILVELATKEDCETWDDAISRMTTALNELADVLEAIQESADNEAWQSLAHLAGQPA